VDEKKLVCVWCMEMEKLLCSQLVPGTNKQFLGLVLTATRLLEPLEPAKSVTQTGQSPARDVWKTCLLAHIALQAPYMHCNRMA
jgi:hypothetical protein